MPFYTLKEKFKMMNNIELYEALKNNSWKTENGKMIYKIMPDLSCYEAPNIMPIHLYSYFPLAEYKGIGKWTNDKGKEFEIFRIHGDDKKVHISTSFGGMTFYRA